MQRALVAAIGWTIIWASLAHATDYLIEFDTLGGHTPGTGATLGPDALSPSGWRSIGSPSGGRFTNQTGRTIRAIYLKRNFSGDRFVVNTTLQERLFATIWIRDDGTEAYFMDGNIPYSAGPSTGKFWMRVPANSQSQIAACDDPMVARCPFTGQVFESNPSDPSGEHWTKIKSGFDGLGPSWRALFAACPSELREIKAYGEANDGRRIVFISNGEAVVFDSQKEAISTLATQRTEFGRVNRIVVDGSKAQLFENGRKLFEFDLDKEKVYPLGSITPQ